MIASTALELLLMGLALWQLVVVRRSIRADRETAERRRAEGQARESAERADVESGMGGFEQRAVVPPAKSG